MIDRIMSKLGSTALDLLSYLPYFKGKGRIALLILRLCRPVLPLTTRLPNSSRLWIDEDDAGHLLLPYLIGKYEHEVYVTFLKCLSHLQPGEVFVDVGANVGFYSILAAEHFRKVGGGSVHAFEPNPRAFAYLQKNSGLNRFTNLFINQEGIADTQGNLTMYVSPYAITTGSLRPVESFLTQCIEIPVTTLDDYLRQHSNLKVGLMKIDIEGGELLALRGGRQMLERDQPIIIYEEFEGFCHAFGHTIRDLRSYLQSFGYNLFVIRPHWPQGSRLLPTSDTEADKYHDTQNVVAVPSSRVI